ncbi:Ras small GTPase family Ras protein [Rhizoctonia solani 123E]|uniref:Ras small GTPase family Ras protein n=1 Tax=Rhizoctonia solani 123E TaxID=1423351 RepID=A0A074RRT7_9AGAM|nr:Ras small GTPase family Ras protein [Rhizoctonia solani 123E]
MAIVDSNQQPEATYLTVTYDPFGQGTTIHAAVIPLTNNYTVALNSAQEALQKHFPHGSSTRPRWLAIPVKTLTTAGFSWAEISPKLFPEIIKKPGIELRLCEDHRHVNILPFGNDGNTSYRFKVITIGDSSVGKSMMLQHFTKPEGSRSDAPPVTLGVHPDVSTRFMTAQGARLKVVLWDTAGQEHYRSIVTSYFRRANGVFLVYSVTNRPSFLACQNWLKDLYNNIGGPRLQNVPIMLIGNQIDLGHLRKVTTSEGEAFALNNGLLFAEVSAKEGTGVEYAFQNLVDEVFTRLKEQNRLSDYETSKGTQNVELHAKESKIRLDFSGCASSTYDAGAYVAGKTYSAAEITYSAAGRSYYNVRYALGFGKV